MTGVRRGLAAAAATAALAVALALSGCGAPAPAPVPVSAPAPVSVGPPAAAWPLGAIGLPNSPAAGGAGTVVALVDSGLTPGIVPDGVIDARSRSFVDDETLAHDDGHGTQMAELIHQVAPEAGILALKALAHDGSGRTSAVVEAVDFAIAQRADVIALSLEESSPDADLEQALTRASTAGALIVVAAGNQQLDLDRFARYPASYDLPNSVVVAALDENGALTAATNWGATSVDIAAPGSDIPVTGPDGSAITIEGSSAAAALTAGAAALLLTVKPASAAAASRALLSAAAPVPDLAGRVASAGRLDVAAALALLAG